MSPRRPERAQRTTTPIVHEPGSPAPLPEAAPDREPSIDHEIQRRLDHAAEGIHWVGADGTVLWANQTELDSLGYARDEYIGRHIADFHVDREAIDDILARLSRGETLKGYEARLRHKDGSIRTVQINSNVLWRNGRFLHTQCFTRDITERKAAEALALRLAHLVEHADDAIISQDLDGVITSWNHAAERIYGYAAADAVGQPISLIIPRDRVAEEALVVRRIRRGETVQTFDTLRRRKDGTLVAVALTVSPIRDHTGRVIGASKTARDISRRRRLEARDRFLVELNDLIRPLTDPEAITDAVARALGEHLGVNRCAYAMVEADEDAFQLTGHYHHGVENIAGHYRFSQFGEACLRLLRSGAPCVVADSDTDPRLGADDRQAYARTSARAVIFAPIRKQGRLVAGMAVYSVPPRDWHAEDVELVQRVADRCWESIERARVTHELRESEHLFRALANSIANLAWMARPDGWISWYNDQWYAYTGTTPEQMQGWGWERVHDPAILPDVKSRWQQSIASGQPFEMVFPLRGADGQFRRFLTRVNPVRDSRGTVVHWFGTNTDVENERRATEANVELRERERLAREEAELQKRLLYSLFMQAPTLIIVLRGPTHVIELANPPACEVMRHTEAELLDRPLGEVVPELRQQAFVELLDEAYRSGTPYAGTETPARLVRDGVERLSYFNFVYSPFRNIEGAIDGIFVIASDVTEQVLARNQVNALREAAEAANRAKDEFLAMLGHELRNPLSPILTALQLMRLRGVEGAERERTVIERQVTHLTRLVDDLLDVSRIARGRVELKEEQLEIADVVAKGIEMASPLLEQRMHTLTLDVPRRGLPVRGDATRLGQVVTNLVTNAAKYTPAGGQLAVSAREDAGAIVLRVRDTGMGIEPDVLPRIFDLFVQERQAIDRSQGGLGLGLTIVRSLVERHGGTVAAHSRGRGLGSEFVVRLPKAAAAEADDDGGAPVSLAARALPPPSFGTRVLIVDDNVDAASMLASLLEELGCVTRVAHDAPGALQLALEFRPRVAFLDIGLPVMDGYELGARLKEQPGHGALDLIALTGYGQDSDRQKTLAAGFRAHLVKPIDVDVLQRLLHGFHEAGEGTAPI